LPHFSDILGDVFMRKNRKNTNNVTVIALILFALGLLLLVPVVGDWILDAIVTTEPTVPGSSAPTASSSVPPSSSVPVFVDTTAPVISGTRDMVVYAGDAVSYRSGVTVSDDIDTKPTLSIDNSKVDLNKPGTYQVTYTARDAAGNTTSVTITLTVREMQDGFVAPEVIYAKADAILAQFIREDMTDREKVEAIYVWSRRDTGHLTYGSAPKGFDHESADWLQTAYQLLNRDVSKGDCFFFFAVQKLLLQRLNIPTIDCEKIYDGNSHHYWLLVSVDGGKSYYHFDNVWSKSLCLVTDAELDAFSAAIDSNPFNRNPNLYPATPTEKLPPRELPWEDPAILAAKP
jgi:hypothetical protein